MGFDDFHRSYPLCTVCEVTRDFYDMVNINRDKIEESLYLVIVGFLQTQMRMQKKMDAKLRQYKADYEKEIFKTNPNYEEKERLRSERLKK